MLNLPKQKCQHCGNEYQKNKKYSIAQWNQSKFCSYKCGAGDKRKKKLLKIEKTKQTCQNCKKKYLNNMEFSWTYWKQKKYCSIQCAGEAKKIIDEFKNRGERYRRKRGSLKQHTPEWLEKIRAKTSEAMLKPEINFKIRQPRSPLQIEHRIKISNALAGKMPKNMWFNSNNYPNIQNGDYENSKGTMYFRSKWEANYALFLDYLIEKKQIKSWEYEPDTLMFEQIKLGTRSYRPDFKVFNNNGSFEYHEIKGYMDSKSKTKLKRMAKYYPEIKLILIDSIYYRDLVKKMGKILSFY